MEPEKFYEKRLPHYKWTDWYSHRNHLESGTNNLSNNSVLTCRGSSELRRSVANSSSAREEITNMHLSERLHEVNHWFKKLETALEDLKDQMTRLTEVKASTEKTIFQANLFLEATKDILSIRDRRRAIDLVEDDTYVKTKEELDLLTRVLKRLRLDADESTLLLTELKEQKDKLLSDLRDKDSSLKIDSSLLTLTSFAKDAIALKPWPDEKPELSVDVRLWLSNCVGLKRNADEILERTFHKISASRNLIKDTMNDIEKCREVTRNAICRRLQETYEARDNLITQRKRLMDRASKVDDEVKSIETSISDNRSNLKLVHTRMEDRKFRPRKELCYNNVDQKLLDENAHLKEFYNECTKTLEDLKTLLNSIHKQLQDVENDLQRKENSLAIEVTCLNIHDRPPKSPFQSEIAWLNPSPNSSYVTGFIERHLNDREFSPMYQNESDNTNYINRRLLELSLTVPPLNRQEERNYNPSKILCRHW